MLPTGPEKLPDWMPESRIAGLWSTAHHSPCVVGMERVRQESAREYVAAVSASELQAGR